MKVIFISSSEARIRVTSLLPELEKAGIIGEERRLPKKGVLNKFRFFSALKVADAVVLKRNMLTGLSLYWCRKFAKVLLFDFDDAIYLKNGQPSLEPQEYKSFSRQYKFNKVVKKVDHVIAANKVLAHEVNRVAPCKPCSVIPSAVEIPSWQKSNYVISDKPKLVWVGTEKTLRYLKYAQPMLAAACQKVPFVLQVVSSKSIELDGIEVEFIPWSLDGQYKAIAEADVGIMPLLDDPFSRGKSSYKLLQYMTVGTPSICSAVGMNNDVSNGNEYCLSATDNEFAEELVRLLSDESLRKSLAEKSVMLIRERYCIEAVGKQLAEVLLTAVEE